MTLPPPVAKLLRLGIKNKQVYFVLRPIFRNFASKLRSYGVSAQKIGKFILSCARFSVTLRTKYSKVKCLMQTIQVKDKQFAVSIPAGQIAEQVKRVADEINRDYAGQSPIFLAVLNGSFIFAADLLREVTLPCEISFVKLASYQGVNTTGKIREVIGLNTDITRRPVIIVEDIVDTGLTMAHMIETLKAQNPASIDICTLLMKPDKLKVELDIRYCAMQIPNDFIVGYGLDYDGFGRNTRDIYTLADGD